MSRYTIDAGEYGTVAYGHDHAVGCFMQVFDSEGELIGDRDALFGGLTGETLALTLLQIRKAGGNVPAGHIVKASRGLSF